MTRSDARPELAVGLLEARQADDARLVDRLTRLTNDVYRTAESGLWRDGAARTTARRSSPS